MAAAPMIRRRAFVHACASMAMLHAARLMAQDAGLFEQSASALLSSQFGSVDLSWLLLGRFGRIAAQRGFQSDQAVAPGSLLKPFVASAYGEQHQHRHPTLQCRGTLDHCWYPHGHGLLGLQEAIAQSCNAYFLGLARGLERNRALFTFQRFGLEGATAAVTASDWIGLTAAWRETPLALTLAYQKLLGDRADPAWNTIAAGMQSAASSGTARAAGAAFGTHALLAKTGTASCSHRPRAMADGFAVLLYPAAQPRVLLLVRRHGATGAETSATAGVMLRALELGIS